MKKLLVLKHWQLFLLLFVVPFALQMGLMGYLFTKMAQQDLPLPADDPAAFLDFFSQTMVLVFVVAGVIIALHLAWQYTLGSSLYEKLPSGVEMNLNLFRAFLVIPFVYMVFSGFFMADMLSDVLTNQVPPALAWFPLIIPLHLFSIFCMFYSIYFNAKCLKAVELQRPVTTNDYLGEFFLLWFYPIGVWILQPRINKLFGEDSDNLRVL